MLRLLYHTWDDECVTYNVESADLCLLSFFNAELLQLMKKEIPKKELIVRIEHFYQLDEIEAQSVLNDLMFQFQNVGLLD